MKKIAKIHLAGLNGYTYCGYGRKLVKILHITSSLSIVTCKNCLSVMKRNENLKIR